MMKAKKGMTLLEILVVIIIVGILSTLGLVNYGRLAERRRQQLAGVALKYIQAAEELYQVEYRQYYQPGNATPLADINNFLRLSLDDRDWGYNIAINPPNVYTLTATRQGNPGCTVSLIKNQNNNEPVVNCP